MSLKIIDLRLQPHLPGANELTDAILSCCQWDTWEQNLVWNQNIIIFIQEGGFENVACDTAAIFVVASKC